MTRFMAMPDTTRFVGEITMIVSMTMQRETMSMAMLVMTISMLQQQEATHMSGLVLILGANGRFGRHAVDAFWNAGWRVRQFDRSSDDLATAARGADVIVNGWNPPYQHWARDLPKLTQQVIDAAKISGATVIVPGNVYVYGTSAPGILSGGTPHSATNALGRLRIDMEAAYRASGIRVINLRAGDFIDTEPSGNWFDAVITKKAQSGVVTNPGDETSPHAWAYLHDLARAAVKLAEMRDALDPYQEVLFPGYTLTLSELADLVERATGTEQTLRDFSWFSIRLAVPFWPMARHLLEMRYLWSMPHRIDGTQFHQLLPGFRATDPLTAIASALNQDIDPNRSMAGGADHVLTE